MSKTIFRILFVGLLMLSACLSVNTISADDGKMSKAEKKEQEEKLAKQIEEALTNGKIEFVATRISPSGYSSKSLNINDNYRVKIGVDTVKAFLPYIGNVQTVSISGIVPDMAIDFTSTDFTKKISIGKKNWNLKITINDNRQYAYRLILSVSKTGITNLTVSDSKRQSVSFSGFLKFL